MKTVTSRIEQQKKIKTKYYKLSQKELYDTDRKAVIESLNLKFKNDSPETTQIQPQQAVQPGQKLDYCLYKNESSAPENKPENQVIQDVALPSNFQIPITQLPVPIPKEEWDNPELIADVASMLEYCDSEEMLTELRQCDIPADIFRLAARQLPQEKRDQIRQWVAVSSLG